MKKYLFFFLATALSTLTDGRSVHRVSNPTIPCIRVKSTNQAYTDRWPKTKKRQICTLQSKFSRLSTLKGPLKRNNFKKRLLPADTITYRSSNKTVQTDAIKEASEKLLEELLSGKTKFESFTILKDRDFNYKTLSGLLVVKFKEHPFVLKLFIEHPHTFVKPMENSFEASCIFVLSGTMRHLSGLTRIQNLENAKKALSKDAQYKYFIDFPRKWYWMPKNNTWLDIEWNDKNSDSSEQIKIPSIYGIVCDYIETDKKLQKQELHTLRQISVDVANYLHYIIDPHVDNFVPEKNSKKVVIIDTEHFPSLAGLSREMNANGYIQWYLELTGKFIKSYLLRSKQTRIKDQCSA